LENGIRIKSYTIHPIKGFYNIPKTVIGKNIVRNIKYKNIFGFLVNSWQIYNKSLQPYLKLAPLKVEIIHLEPLIVFFRRAISEKEIELVKQLATPQVIIINSR
jgi:hypothetical protein